MSPNTEAILSAEAKEILEEIMNIAFGNASAEIAELTDIHVVLNVPNVDVINTGELSVYLKNTLALKAENSLIEQKFWGDFKGSGMLTFSSDAINDIIASLNIKNSSPETSSLLDMSNVLISACVGKVAGLLGTLVTYSPPAMLNSDNGGYEKFISNFAPDQTVIVMKTVFEFKEKDFSGFLLLLTNHESTDWLQKALDDFIESYE